MPPQDQTQQTPQPQNNQGNYSDIPELQYDPDDAQAFESWPSTGPKSFDGMVEPGNIDLTKRPLVHHPDGSVSSLYSGSFHTDKGEVLVPFVSPQGEMLNLAQAKQRYKDTGEHLGIFKTPDQATAYSLYLHKKQGGFQSWSNGGKYNPSPEVWDNWVEGSKQPAKILKRRPSPSAQFDDLGGKIVLDPNAGKKNVIYLWNQPPRKLTVQKPQPIKAPTGTISAAPSVSGPFADLGGVQRIQSPLEAAEQQIGAITTPIESYTQQGREEHPVLARIGDVTRGIKELGAMANNPVIQAMSSAGLEEQLAMAPEKLPLIADAVKSGDAHAVVDHLHDLATGGKSVFSSLGGEVVLPSMKSALSPQQAVEAAGGVYRGQNKAGLVEITLPESMTQDLPVSEPLKKFVSVTMPADKVTPESVKAAMEEKRVAFGGKPAEKTISEHANAFNQSEGRPALDVTPKNVSAPFAKQMADHFDTLKHEPENPEVQKSYDSLKSDIDKQWDYATGPMGMKFEPWTKEGQPYANSKEMMADVKDNHHLYFFQGGKIPADHPMAEVDSDTGLKYMDKLRAIHDLFGHAAEGFQFGPVGEENAYLLHRQMFSPESVPALTNETRAQNAWVNFGKHMRDEQGNVIQKGQSGYVAPPDRPYAEQKATSLAPEYLVANTANMETVRSLVNTAKAFGDQPFTSNDLKLFSHMDQPEVERGLQEMASSGILQKVDATHYQVPGGKPLVDESMLSKKVETPITDNMIEKFGTTDDPHKAGFITPSGKMIPYAQEHESMIGLAKGNLGVGPEDKGKFVENEGTIRTIRRGDTIAFSVPSSGVTDEQIAKMKQSVLQMGRSGPTVIVETGDAKNSVTKPWATANDIEPLLRQVGAHPEVEAGTKLEAKHMTIPAELKIPGADTPWVLRHELGHAVVGDALGVNIGEIQSHLHPELRGSNAAAAIVNQFPGAYRNDEGKMVLTHNQFANIFANTMVPTLAGGGAAQELIDGVPMSSNRELGGDWEAFTRYAGRLGFSPSETQEIWFSGVLKAKKILRQGNALDKIKEYAGMDREDGLDATLHMSRDRVRQMLNEVKESRSEQTKLPGKSGAGENVGGTRGGVPAVESAGARAGAEGSVGERAIQQASSLESRKKWTTAAVDLMKESPAGAIDPRTGKVAKEGFGVEVYPEAREDREPLDHPPTEADLQKFYDDNKEIFEKHPELRVGWDQTPKGWELNIGASGTRSGAAFVGRELGQRAAWDIGKQEEIPTGGTGERTNFSRYKLEERLADLTGKNVEKLPDEIKTSPHLTDDEKTLLASDPGTLKDFQKTRKKIASPEELGATMVAGRANRFWYERAQQAVDKIFSSMPAEQVQPGDREKFTALLAATSPQQDPTLNSRTALTAWKRWTDAGRPSDPDEIRSLFLPKKGGNAIMMTTHAPNAVRALTGQELSGPKVGSFRINLSPAEVDPRSKQNVTNDMWGAITNGIIEPRDLTRNGAYIALSENYRKAAADLGWEPKQGQAASWGFVRTLGYASGWKGSGNWLPPTEVVKFVDDPMVRKYSADIADIFLTDPEVRSRVEELGIPLETFDANLREGIKDLGRGGEGKAEGTNPALLAQTAKRVEKAKQHARSQVAEGKRIGGKMEGLFESSGQKLGGAKKPPKGVSALDFLASKLGR